MEEKLWDRSYKSAEEFLEAISPRNRELWPEFPKYLFRGHANSEWALTPQVHREQTRPKYMQKLLRDNNFTPLQYQILTELETLSRFARAADEQGFPLPGDSIEFRKHWFLDEPFANPQGCNEIRDNPEIWPPPQVLPMLCLAQHYGLPTRLLDWSVSPYVAAFFAARDAAAWDQYPDCNRQNVTHLAVWALDKWQVKMEQAPDTFDKRHRIVLGVMPPRAPNPNMTAQKGAFTFFRPAKDYTGQIGDETRCLSAVVEDHVRRYDGGDAQLSFDYTHAPIRRFLLPITQARWLLKLLSNEGFHAGTVYPGLQAAAMRVFDESLWILES